MKPRAKKAVPKKKPAARAKVPQPDAYEDFMAGAYVMELEAAERYADFAMQMEMHNNSEVAQLFRKLAKIEGLHARQILDEMGWKTAPRGTFALRREAPEGAETVPMTELHYLMQPWHALELALESERRAEQHYAKVARDRATPAKVKKVAAEMQADEQEHVRLILEWMKKVPKPDAGWDHDPDPALGGD
jgi:rubrerythrin